jgi:hypothetical protein
MYATLVAMRVMNQTAPSSLVRGTDSGHVSTFACSPNLVACQRVPLKYLGGLSFLHARLIVLSVHRCIDFLQGGIGLQPSHVSRYILSVISIRSRSDFQEKTSVSALEPSHECLFCTSITYRSTHRSKYAMLNQSESRCVLTIVHLGRRS